MSICRRMHSITSPNCAIASSAGRMADGVRRHVMKDCCDVLPLFLGKSKHLHRNCGWNRDYKVRYKVAMASVGHGVEKMLTPVTDAPSSSSPPLSE